MLVEEPKIVNIRKPYDYSAGTAERHIGTESEPVLCGKNVEGLDIGAGFGAKEDEICPECVARSLGQAVELAEIAESLDAIVAELRCDGQSLFDYGHVPKAIGHVRKAVEAMMEEARHRALAEQLRPNQRAAVEAKA